MEPETILNENFFGDDELLDFKFLDNLGDDPSPSVEYLGSVEEHPGHNAEPVTQPDSSQVPPLITGDSKPHSEMSAQPQYHNWPSTMQTIPSSTGAQAASSPTLHTTSPIQTTQVSSSQYFDPTAPTPGTSTNYPNITNNYGNYYYPAATQPCNMAAPNTVSSPFNTSLPFVECNLANPNSPNGNVSRPAPSLYHMENQLLINYTKADPRATFTTVSGRLSIKVTGRSKMLPMSVGEVQRRLSAPEALNLTELSKIMRRGHSAALVCDLRNSLKSVGVELLLRRPEAKIPITLFTSLTETEAIELANDFNTLVGYFPSRQLAQHTVANYGTEWLPYHRDCLNITRQVLGELFSVLERDRAPVGNTYPQQLLDDTLQAHLNDFSALTHGFGAPVISSAIKIIMRYIGEAVQIIETKQQQQ